MVLWVGGGSGGLCGISRSGELDVLDGSGMFGSLDRSGRWAGWVETIIWPSYVWSDTCASTVLNLFELLAELISQQNPQKVRGQRSV